MRILYKNSKIITLDKNDKLRPVQSWMIINGDTIESIGSNSDNIPEVEFSKIVDLDSKYVLPGLHDCHLHVGHLGEQLNTLSLKGCEGKENFVEKIRNYITERIKHHEKSDILIIKALEWEQDVLGFLPDRFLLDKICAEFPEYRVLSQKYYQILLTLYSTLRTRLRKCENFSHVFSIPAILVD